MISYVTRSEIDACSPPRISPRTGRRDRALLLVATQTGPRVSELTGLRRQDLTLGTGTYQSCSG